MLELAIVHAIEDVTGIIPMPVFAFGQPPFIVYNHTPLIGGVAKQSQLEIKVIDEDFDKVLEISKNIKDKFDLNDRLDSLYYDGILFRSSLSGGGDLYDEETECISRSLIFTITWLNNLNGGE